MKFRKRPIVIDAVQWKPNPKYGVFKKGKYWNISIGYDEHGVEYTVCDVGLHTLEGFAKITPMCWIVTGVKKERYVVQPDIFALTYEAVIPSRKENKKLAELYERKIAEGALHESDFTYGTPLDIGDGYTVAFHSASCAHCEQLRKQVEGRQ